MTILSIFAFIKDKKIKLCMNLLSCIDKYMFGKPQNCGFRSHFPQAETKLLPHTYLVNHKRYSQKANSNMHLSWLSF